MIPLLLSNRARQTPASPIRRLSPLARKAVADGKRVFHLNIGQPDIESPKEFLDGVRLYNDKVVSYEISEGSDALRSSWANYINRTLNLSLSKEQMLITTGASEALIFTFMTCCDPGDDVIIFDPTYANYIGFAAISGVRLVPVMTKLKNGFSLPPVDEIASKFTNRTRAILLCSPNNPTGTVYTRKELEMLLALCNERNIFLVVDETYREIVYDGKSPLSILHLDSNNKRIIVIDSLSKRFSLCGARIGCLITPNEEVIANALNQAQARLSCASIEQFAAAHMLSSINDDYVKNVVACYERRRNALCDAINQIPEVEVFKPHGALYAIVRLPIPAAEEFARFMLTDFSHDNKTVFASPAAGFYMHGESGLDKLRLGFVLKEEDLVKAVEVMAMGLDVFRKRRK